MPHYLRMLTYARQPDIEWGPAKNVNRYGRYTPKSVQLGANDGGSSLTLDSQKIFRTQL
jgi:hypothetical protein